MDRELTRAELDELLPVYALDALDGDEREQVERYVERNAAARAEVLSLREVAALLPPLDARAPASLWGTIESSLAAPTTGTPGPELPTLPGTARSERWRARRSYRLVAGVLAAAAMVAIVALGIQTVRQQDRIDELAAEMHRETMQQQAMAARSDRHAHVIELAAASGTNRGEIVMLPNGTGYFMDHNLPALPKGSTYQLWAKVGDPASPRMISLGVLGTDPQIAAFRLSAPTIMFEVTREHAPGNVTPNASAVMSGMVA